MGKGDLMIMVEVEPVEERKAGGGETTGLSRLWIFRLLMSEASSWRIIEGMGTGSLADHFSGDRFSFDRCSLAKLRRLTGDLITWSANPVTPKVCANWVQEVRLAALTSVRPV